MLVITIRTHRLHAVHELQSVATEVAHSVGHTGELCENGWTDRNAV